MNNLNSLLNDKKLVKIIAGINNTNLENITHVIQAANNGNAHAVDVAAKADIVKTARTMTDKLLFASSIKPSELLEAINAGADVAEIGNFDALYEEGIFLTYSDVLAIAEETKALLPEGTPICVTIPGFLPEEAQVRLAKALEVLGVTMLQTEGVHKAITHHPNLAQLSAEEKALLTFKNTQALSKASNLPIMTATGINANNVANAFDAGASAVGIGSVVNKLNTVEEMTAVIEAVMLAAQITKAKLLSAIA